MPETPTTMWLQAFAFLALVFLSGCSSLERTGVAQAPPAASEQPAPRTPGTPPIPLGGRWTLSATGAGACVMTINEGPKPEEGTVAPEGGCPGSFFTTRKWTFEGGVLILRDHTGQPLGELNPSPPGRYDGQATGGMQVSLSR